MHALLCLNCSLEAPEQIQGSPFYKGGQAQGQQNSPGKIEFKRFVKTLTGAA